MCVSIYCSNYISQFFTVKEVESIKMEKKK